jgi:arylsulfatase A-like enzyme
MQQKPNIIFILTDDQRADSLGCMGNREIRTPNLDRLAGEGVLFENAFVSSAICTPSRACFFLGQYERRHGVNFNSGTSIAPEAWEQSYPMILRRSGYYTGYVGKNHVPIGEGGYDSGYLEQSFDYWYAGHQHLTFYPKKKHAIFANAEANTQVEIIEEGVMNFLEPNREFMDRAVQFIDTRDAEKPFCLSVCFNVPHGSSIRSMKLLPDDPELYRTAYRDLLEALELPATYVERGANREPKLPSDVHRAVYRQKEYDYVNTPEKLREYIVRTYQTITGVDRFVGEMRLKLEKLGIAHNTILVFTSDHGILYGEHGLGGKALNYEPCLHVPFIVYDPRLPSDRQGRKEQKLVQSIDTAPTMLSWAGVDIPATMQGRSIAPLLAGDQSEWREHIFAENLWSTEFGNPVCETVRSASWKYTRYFENKVPNEKYIANPYSFNTTDECADLYEDSLTRSIRGELPVYEELFHLAEDPLEQNNRANDEAVAHILAQFRSHADRLVKEAREGASGPLTIPLSSERRQQLKKLIPEN